MEPEAFNFLAPLIQTLGPAGLAFGIMYLWLRREQERTKTAEDRADTLQTKIDRLHETRATEQAALISVLQAGPGRMIQPMQLPQAVSASQGWPADLPPSYPPSSEPPS